MATDMRTPAATRNNPKITEDSIDLVELADVLIRRWWVLAMSFIIGAVLLGVGTKVFITPQYKASSMIYIYSKSTSITSLADLQIGSQLAVDFQIVGTTREVMENVINKLGIDTTYEDLLEIVKISNPTGSHILKIDVQSPDPVMAANISNMLADELRMRIADVMNTDEPSLVERAVVPVRPVSPSVTKNVAMGGIGAAVVAAVIFIISFLLDDTVKTEDDVKRYLGLNVLAAIPAESSKQ